MKKLIELWEFYKKHSSWHTLKKKKAIIKELFRIKIICQGIYLKQLSLIIKKIIFFKRANEYSGIIETNFNY